MGNVTTISSERVREQMRKLTHTAVSGEMLSVHRTERRALREALEYPPMEDTPDAGWAIAQLDGPGALFDAA